MDFKVDLSSLMKNAGFMGQVLGTTVLASGVVVTNLGLLKAINTTSSIALATVSYLQGMGVESNELKEGKQADLVGKKLQERAWVTIRNDLKDIPKIAFVIGAGAAMMYAGTICGAKDLTSMFNS